MKSILNFSLLDKEYSFGDICIKAIKSDNNQEFVNFYKHYILAFYAEESYEGGVLYHIRLKLEQPEWLHNMSLNSLQLELNMVDKIYRITEFMDKKQYPLKREIPSIKKVEWNVLKKDRSTKDGKVWASAGNISTVVFWSDNTVTSVICSDEDEFNVWTGVITAIAKKGGYYQDIHRYEKLFEKEYREKLFPSELPATNAKHGHAGQKYIMDDTGSVKRVGRPRKSNKSK